MRVHAMSLKSQHSLVNWRRCRIAYRWALGLVVLALGLAGCLPPKDEYVCESWGSNPEVCIDVSSVSAEVQNVPITHVITLKSSSDLKDVTVAASIAPFNPQIGKFDTEPVWVVDLVAGVPKQITFSVELFQPGYYTLVAHVFPSMYDPIADLETLEVGVATLTPMP